MCRSRSNNSWLVSDRQLDPSGLCDRPATGPFGQDAEILLNDVQYEPKPEWSPYVPPAVCVGCLPYDPGHVAAVTLGTEKIVYVAANPNG